MTYIAYYRTSTKDQNLGIDAQRNIIQNHVQKKGSQIILEVEEHESGEKNARPELLRALDECTRTGATLIVAKLDRLGRDVEFLFRLKKGDVKFECCDIPELNTLSLGIFATFAQHERELISKRTKEALNALKEKGVKLGNPRIHEIDREKAVALANKAVKDKANANINNIRAFEVIAGARKLGKNWAEITKMLDGKFETSQGKKKWSINQVQRIFHRYNQD